MQQVTTVHSRPPGRLMQGAGRPLGRSECTRCTDAERSTARSTVIWKLSTSRSTDWKQAALGLGPVNRTVDHGHGSVDRPIDRQTRFDFPFGIRIPFLFEIESNRGFLKLRGSVAINKG